jgi:hypothetical protein
VDACPYDALRDGGDFELSHTSRAEPAIDLIALAGIDRETEVTYIQRERDWASRAAAAGRQIDVARMLPVLPPAMAGIPANGGNGHDGHGHDHGANGHGAVAALGPGGHE